MTSSDKKPSPRRNALLDTLRAEYPVFRDTQPLAIGIHKAIRILKPEIDAAALRTALRLHTTSTAYLKVLSRAERRFDLAGEPVGEVSPEQREQAESELRERFKKAAEKRQAEADAARRQDKLLELTRKFGRH